MSDDLDKRGPQDRIRININEPWEVRDWAIHFAVSKAKIIEAVKSVGVMVKDVEKYLEKG